MAHEDKEAEVAEPVGQAKPKLTLIVILAVLLGVFLALSIGGAIYHFQSGKAVQSELAAAREDLKHKTLMLTEAQEQIANLSMQMHTLREFSVAKASGVAAEKELAGQAASGCGKQQRSHASFRTREKGSTCASHSPCFENTRRAAGAKKAKPGNLDCQITGKSPEEQQATLKRCTQAMDGKK